MMQNIYLASLTLHMMHNMEEKDLQPQKYHLLTIVALSFLRAMIDAMRISMIIRSYGSNYPRLKLFFSSSSSFEDV